MVRMNAEILAGIAILMMGIIFILAGTINSTWGEIMLPSFVIAALGAATLGLGIWTANYEAKHSIHTHHH